MDKMLGINRARLRGLRVEKGFTQVELAKLLKISEKTYVLKENGRVPFKDYEIAELCEIFKKNVSYFFTN